MLPVPAIQINGLPVVATIDNVIPAILDFQAQWAGHEAKQANRVKRQMSQVKTRPKSVFFSGIAHRSKAIAGGTVPSSLQLRTPNISAKYNDQSSSQINARNTSGSTLPPLATQHTERPRNRSGAASSAATESAPVGSTLRFAK